MGVDTTDDELTIRPPNSESSCGGGALVEDTASVGVVFQANEAREGQGESEFQCKSIERRAVDSPLGMEGKGRVYHGYTWVIPRCSPAGSYVANPIPVPNLGEHVQVWVNPRVILLVPGSTHGL